MSLRGIKASIEEALALLAARVRHLETLEPLPILTFVLWEDPDFWAMM